MTDVLVPVADSVTIRNTVAYVVRDALERAREDGSRATIHFVHPVSRRVADGAGADAVADARATLDRVTAWAEADLDDDGDRVAVETALVGTDEYLFAPDDYADVFARYASEHDIDRAVFDPAYAPVGTTPLLPTLEAAVRRAGLDVEEAPVERDRRSASPVGPGTVQQFLVLFGASFCFYLVLAGSLVPFELATGAASAAVVAAALWRVSFAGGFDPARAAGQVGRMALYAPFLLWEIARTNVQLAYITLHPDLPLDPEMVEFEAGVESELEATTLANSITLTPGDLTVDVAGDHFTVHVLTPADRENLLEGTLERPVRYVFHGRTDGTSDGRQQTDEEGS